MKTIHPVIWWGFEKVGPRIGMPTLFVPRGEEFRINEGIKLCQERGYPVNQIYFGAKDKTRHYDDVLSAIKRILPKPVLFTLEVSVKELDTMLTYTDQLAQFTSIPGMLLLVSVDVGC